jgi:predicted transcriptional regulator
MTDKLPTPSETVVLQLLWERGDASVPELHKAICETAEVGYTTVLKRIQRMEEKALIKRVSSQGRAHRYTAIYKPQKTRCSLVERLLKTAFDDSPNALIQHAIGQHKLSSDDIEQIRALLDEVEKSGLGK